MSLSGKVAIVTGASSGIGACIAERLSAEGVKVVAHYANNPAGVNKKRTAISLNVYADFRQANEWTISGIFFRCLGLFGKIDILINNAGAVVEPSWKVSEVGFDQTIAINLKAPFLLSRMVIGQMMKQGTGGRIVNISSVAAKYGSVDTAHYAMAKAGLEALTLCLAKVGAPHNILANTVRCGVIDTGLHKKLGREDMSDRIAKIPLKRMGTPGEVTDMVLFLLSSKADYITGQTFSVSGGE